MFPYRRRDGERTQKLQNSDIAPRSRRNSDPLRQYGNPFRIQQGRAMQNERERDHKLCHQERQMSFWHSNFVRHFGSFPKNLTMQSQ